MKYLILYASILFAANLSFGQATFEKKINVGLGDVACSVRQLQEGYLLTGSQFCNGIESQCFSIIRTDRDGNPIFIKEYQNIPWWFCSSNFAGNTCVVVAPDSSFYFTGVIEPQGQQGDVFLMKTDYNGDSLWLKVFGGNSPLISISRDIIQTSDSTLLLFSDKATGDYDSNPWLVEVDMDGNVLWEFEFGQQYIACDMQSILLMPDGDLVISYITEETLLGGPAMSVARIDRQQGQVRWERRFGEYDGYHDLLHTGLVALDNGGFLVSWQRFNMTPHSFYQVSLTWLDSTGNITKQEFMHDFVTFHINDLIKTTKGTIVGVGDLDLYDYPGLGRLGGWVFEMTQDGEMLWERYIQDISLPDKMSYFNNVIENDSGGITISGAILTPVGYDIWLLQLDSMGCFEPGCTGEVQVVGGVYSSTPEPKRMELKLYPNPVLGERLFIDLPVSMEQEPSTEVVLFDMLGRAIRKEPLSRAVDVSGLEKGTYFLKIKQDGAMLDWVGKFLRG
ncbi:MAG: T9SS type A sorting domain-containing protein [Saprospiraceae bacterium]|nr:T9SS type A sorting domain-containing protein [Saprospiraceae bacterium]